MADDKDKIVKLEERLEKAASTFKDMKAQLEEKEKENETLKTRITELEDELTLNGGAVEEVEGLKGRLEKAKEIFATQKAKIAELTEQLSEKSKMFDDVRADLAISEKQASELTEEVKALHEENDGLSSTINQIREILNA